MGEAREKPLSGLDFSPSGPGRPLGSFELFEPGGRGSQGGRVKQKQSKASKQANMSRASRVYQEVSRSGDVRHPPTCGVVAGHSDIAPA